jgi:hypothetical protein
MWGIFFFFISASLPLPPSKATACGKIAKAECINEQLLSPNKCTVRDLNKPFLKRIQRLCNRIQLSHWKKCFHGFFETAFSHFYKNAVHKGLRWFWVFPSKISAIENRLFLDV